MSTLPITFVREMPPLPKERGKTTLVPMWMYRREIEEFLARFNRTAPAGKDRGIKWQATNETTLRNDPFGEFSHYAKVILDGQGNFVEYIDDHVEWSNGPLDPRTRLAKPNVVTAPVFYMEGEWWVLWFNAWREATWDDREVSVPADLTDRIAIEKFIAMNRGKWYQTVPGGWKQWGETSEQAAKREADEEAALIFLNHKQDWRVIQDRSNGQSLVSVGYTTFEIKPGGKLTKDEGEMIQGRFATPIANFYSEDGLVMAAVDTALRDLDMVSSTPITDLTRRFMALEHENAAALEGLLKMLEGMKSNK